MNPIRIALTKGRLEQESVKLFSKIGLDCSAFENKGRKLILTAGNYEAVLAKAADVITYVELGACDIGIVGKDTILERGADVYEMMDLEFGKCRFSLAGPSKSKIFHGHSLKTVATKYPNVARKYFENKGMDIDIIKIEGSVELAPLLSIADAIVDIVESGATLKENGLEELEEICSISARLIVNSASIKLRKYEIEDFLSRVEAAKGA